MTPRKYGTPQTTGMMGAPTQSSQTAAPSGQSLNDILWSHTNANY
jgi:hypothetical protein